MTNNSSRLPLTIALLATVIAIAIGIITHSLAMAMTIVGVGALLAWYIYADTRGGAEATSQDRHAALSLRADGDGCRTLAGTELFCRIAGVEYHNNKEGGFIGVVRFDPNNAYDKNAIAIYSLEGKLLGYIPRTEQEEYRKWTSRDALPCIGFFCPDPNGDLRGRVKVIDADRIIVEIHMVKFAMWIINNYRQKYLPKEFFMYCSAQPRGNDGWLEHLNQVLDEKQRVRKTIDKRVKATTSAKTNQPTE